MSGREAIERWHDSQTKVRADAPAARPDHDEEPATLVWDERAAAHFTRAIVLGEPGAGKSWLLRYEAARLARGALAKLDAHSIRADEVLLPIRLHLAEIVAPRKQQTTSLDGALVRRVCDQAQGHMPSVNCRRVALPSHFESWLRSRMESGHCAVLLDAWDEMGMAHDELRRSIETFASSYRLVRVLVTSREVGYDSTRAPLLKSEELTLVKLDDPAIEGFCRAWFQPDASAPSRTGAAADELSLLEKALADDVSLHDLARNPLMLTLMCRVFEERR